MSDSVQHIASLDWLNHLRGKFIVFDGPDGSGKTTQFRRFCDGARGAGLTVCEVREPGGTAVSERIREILLDASLEEMCVRCELMLYMASRAQLVEERIRPALERGELVAADRYVSSTLAYQGAAGGHPIDEIRAVAQAACGEVWPHLYVIFDVDQKTAAGRLNPLLDRMEQKGVEFHRKVREGYLQQARDDPDHYAVIDGTQDTGGVTRALFDVLRERFVS